MKVAGFSFIKNAILYDYPIVEAIRSVLPLCDVFIVAVGQSDDDTLALIRAMNETKIHIVETEWDEQLRSGGRVLAAETDKAYAAIPLDCDWCFYIQGDEVVHEQDYATIRAAMTKYLNDPATEGLLFHYRHFYASYDYIGISRRWYRKEVRIVRRSPHIHSYKDAQGFRWHEAGQAPRKLRVRQTEAWIYHYGWVKHPSHQLNKQLNFNKLWHSDHWINERFGKAEQYAYDHSEPLEKFSGTHPAVMQARIAAVNWQFASDPTRVRPSLKDRISGWVERHTGWRPGEYKNYELI